MIVRGVGERGEWRAGATPRTCTFMGQSSPEAGTGWRGCGEQLAGVPAASPYGHLASSLWWEVSVVSLQLCSPSPLGRTSCVCGEGSTLMLPGGSTRLPGWPEVPSSWGFSQAPAWAQRCTWTLGSVGPVCVGAWARELLALSVPWVGTRGSHTPCPERWSCCICVPPPGLGASPHLLYSSLH